LKVFSLFISLVLLVSCSLGGRDERYEFKNFYVTGAYDQGLLYLEKAKFYNEKDERLLYLVEKGTLLHSKGDYENALIIFDEAQKLINEMYTIRVSKKLQKGILNDNYDAFYGEIYERSMVYFYSALDAILLFEKNKNRDNLFKARANILAWDSFLNSMKEDRLGESVYKNDLLLKILGAKIHQIVNTREDLQISIQLYKDGKDILLKNYNSYETFNKKANEFKKDFSKLASLSIEEVKKKYIEETPFQKKLSDYLDENIKAKKVKNITIILQNGIIPEKTPEKVHFGLEALSKEPAISMYVASVLGLVPANGGSFNQFSGGVATAQVGMKLFSFGFELPIVQSSPITKSKTLIVSQTGADQKVKEILRKDFILVNPMGELAKEAVGESSTVIYSRIGARLATKHLAAIFASFATFKALGGGTKNETIFAKNVAVLQYAAASRVIEESEKADTRFWSTLPEVISIVDIDLAVGNYVLSLQNEGENEKSLLGKIEITSANENKIVSFIKK
jgi:hypothetical protein